MMKMPLLRQVLTHITETPNDYPVFDSVEKCTEDADVVIDFQMREQWIRFWIIAWIRNFRLCFARQTSEEQLAKAEKAAEKTAVLKSANMSLGINLRFKNF